MVAWAFKSVFRNTRLSCAAYILGRHIAKAQGVAFKRLENRLNAGSDI